MKKMFSTLLLWGMVFFVAAQKDSLQLPPYKRFPTLPPLKLLLTDSTTWFTKDGLPAKKAVMVMLFSPDCDHCKHETEEIIKHIKEFKKAEIVMATTLPFEKMKEFYINYGLERFKNVIVGKDVNFSLPVFYNVRNLPFLAFYDKKGNLIDIFEGSLPVEKVIEKINQ